MQSLTQEHKEESALVLEPTAHRVSLLKAAVHPDPNPSKGGGDIIVDESGALVPVAGPAGSGDYTPIKSNGEISVYIVLEGDTLSQIAEMFDVSANTILWANDIKSADLIRPGYALVILPIKGVRHVVKSGDTLAAIAKKYEGDVDDIIAYNQLVSAEDITEGDTIIVPGGEITPPPAPKVSRSSGGTYIPPAKSGSSAGFADPLPVGVCSQGIHGYNGVDMAAGYGTAVLAAEAGQVILARAYGWNGGYGNYVIVKHSNGTQTLYAHLSSVAVGVGDYVAKREVIGGVGNSGRSTGYHLHFEVRGAYNPYCRG